MTTVCNENVHGASKGRRRIPKPNGSRGESAAAAITGGLIVLTAADAKRSAREWTGDRDGRGGVERREVGGSYGEGKGNGVRGSAGRERVVGARRGPSGAASATKTSSSSFQSSSSSPAPARSTSRSGKGHWRLSTSSDVSQNVGNVLGSRSSVRQSKLFRIRESGNTMKELLGVSHLAWNIHEKQGCLSGRVYDHEEER